MRAQTKSQPNECSEVLETVLIVRSSPSPSPKPPSNSRRPHPLHSPSTTSSRSPARPSDSRSEAPSASDKRASNASTRSCNPATLARSTLCLAHRPLQSLQTPLAAAVGVPWECGRGASTVEGDAAVLFLWSSAFLNRAGMKGLASGVMVVGLAPFVTGDPFDPPTFAVSS